MATKRNGEDRLGIPTFTPQNHDGSDRCYFLRGKLDTGEDAWLYLPGCTDGALHGYEDCMCDQLESRLDEAHYTISQLRELLARSGERQENAAEELLILRAAIRKQPPEVRHELLRLRSKRWLLVGIGSGQ